MKEANIVMMKKMLIEINNYIDYIMFSHINEIYKNWKKYKENSKDVPFNHSLISQIIWFNQDIWIHLRKVVKKKLMSVLIKHKNFKKFLDKLTNLKLILFLNILKSIQ